MMARNRGLVWLRCIGLCTAAILWTVGGTACNKSGGGGAGGAGGGTASGGGGAVTGAAASAMDLIPKDTGLIFGFNWGKFKGSKFYDMLLGAIPPEGKTSLDEVKAACGIDYLNDLDSVIVAAGGNMDKSRVLILVKGNWNEEKVAKCATAMGEKKGKKITVAKDGNITSYTPEGDKTLYVGWVGDTAVVTASSMEGDKAYLSDVLKKASSVKDNKPFMDLFGRTDTGATMYAAFLPPPDSEAATSLGKMTGGNEKMTGGYLTLKLAKDLDLNAGLRFATDADAKSVTDRATKELDSAKKGNPQAAEFLKTASIAQSDKDMVVKINLDEKQLDQLTAMVKQMVPMLGMMLGGATSQ
jgi:hypothetical protein